MAVERTARGGDFVRINRAPVMTLWGTVVAERLGYSRDEALTLGKAVAVLNAQSKGRRLGVFSEGTSDPRKETEATRPEFSLPIGGRTIPIVHTRDGVRALLGGESQRPAGVRGYLERAFGENPPRVEAAMRELAASYSRGALQRESGQLYERFRPAVPAGIKGWGARGDLDLNRIRGLKARTTRPGDCADAAKGRGASEGRARARARGRAAK